MEIEQIKVGQLQTNCYILKDSGEALVIDPGGDLEKIIQHLDNHKVTILNTHYHFDHTLANEELKEKFSANILIHEEEKKYVNFKVDKFLKDGDIIKTGSTKLKVLHTPGHSQGSICLLGGNFAFTGDTLFDGGYGRVDLPGSQPEKMMTSLQKLNSVLEDKTTIYPGHGESFKFEKLE